MQQTFISACGSKGSRSGTTRGSSTDLRSSCTNSYLGPMLGSSSQNFLRRGLPSWLKLPLHLLLRTSLCLLAPLKVLLCLPAPWRVFPAPLRRPLQISASPWASIHLPAPPQTSQPNLAPLQTSDISHCSASLFH